MSSQIHSNFIWPLVIFTWGNKFCFTFCIQVAFELVVNDNLGLMIRGGIEYGLGIYITGVDEESAAFRNGLRVRFSIQWLPDQKLNIQYMTNPTIVYPVKIEYGWNVSISGLKMMVKSGLEKIFLKFLHALTIFY